MDVGWPDGVRHLVERGDNSGPEVGEFGGHRERAEIGHSLHEVLISALAVSQAVALCCSINNIAFGNLWFKPASPLSFRA